MQHMRMRDLDMQHAMQKGREHHRRSWWRRRLLYSLAGIPICVLEMIFLHMHFWPSLIGWWIGVIILCPVAASLYGLMRRAVLLRLLVPRRDVKRSRTYVLGEAILLSDQLIACKMHKGLCLCCEQRTSAGSYSWIYLFVLRENEIHYIDYHSLGVWEDDIKRYGVTVRGWAPAERMLPESVIQRIMEHPAR